MNDQFLTMAEVGREFNLCKATIHTWVNIKKILPASQPVPNGKKFVRRSDIERLLTSKQEAAAKPKRRKSILFPRG